MNRLRALALALVGCLALTGCGFHGLYSAPLPGGANLGSHPYHVLVDFSDVLDLVPQSAVKVNDVSVGKVESVKLVDWYAEVQIAVNGDVRLPANAYAQIRQTSLLGEKFVSLSYPPNGEVADPTALAQAAARRLRLPAHRAGTDRRDTGDRRGAGRAVAAAQRRWPGADQDHHPRAGPGAVRPHRRHPQPAQPDHPAHHQPEHPEGPGAHRDRPPGHPGRHPEPAEAGAGRCAGHAAAGGPGAGRREEPVRHAADQPGPVEHGRGHRDQRRHRQLRVRPEEPGPGDDRADQGRRQPAEVVRAAGHLPVPEDLGERGARRLHQPLHQHGPEPERPAEQPAQAAAGQPPAQRRRPRAPARARYPGWGAEP